MRIDLEGNERKVFFFKKVCLRKERRERKCWEVVFGAKAICIFAFTGPDVGGTGHYSIAGSVQWIPLVSCL